MSLSDKSASEISSLLSDFGIKHGPVVESTRKLYEKKLEKAMKEAAPNSSDKTYYREEEVVTYITYSPSRFEGSADMLKHRGTSQQNQTDHAHDHHDHAHDHACDHDDHDHDDHDDHDHDDHDHHDHDHAHDHHDDHHEAREAELQRHEPSLRSSAQKPAHSSAPPKAQKPQSERGFMWGLTRLVLVLALLAAAGYVLHHIMSAEDSPGLQ
ncbi:emerin (Emery-Dreifuss muscular dystrophy) [Eucyclogobius newberryi]|uniref:emerin (Emery-Dreifuss muscular dystrophy) n=1 Tax=Eucyclogobius newberryi TaxID=166745 RepID=UPI003B5A56F3